MNASARRLSRGIECRRAEPADNGKILAFLARHSMQAGLALRFDRSPDFFALHAAQSPEHESWLLLDRDRIVALGSFIVRSSYVDGRPEPVVYLAELRVSAERKVAGLWHRVMRDRLAEFRDKQGVRFAYCCIIRENRLARQSVLRPRTRGEPAFWHLRGYSNISILARKPWVIASRGDAQVRRATATDAEAIRQFLDAESRANCFGIVFDLPTWQHRLNSWPDFAVENFFLACDADKQIVGCVAHWDSSAINRIVIDRMPLGLEFLRLSYNALTSLTRKAPIRTGPASYLADIALTHLCVARRDPSTFALLLDAVYTEIAATRRYSTVSLCLYDNDSLWPALDRYWHHTVPMDLYGLSLSSESPELAIDDGVLPGFESYLV